MYYTASFVFHSDPPSAPGKPTVSNIDATEMTITWTTPESDGGSPILGYFVEKKEPKSSRWTRINSTPVEGMTFKVKDLVEKSKYHFRVIAANKAGEGPASEPSDVHTAKPPYGMCYYLFLWWGRGERKGNLINILLF